MKYTLVREGGLLLVTAIGEVDLEAALRLQAHALKEWKAKPARAVLYDLRFTTVRITPEDSELLYTAAVRWGFTRCTTNAIVTPERSFQPFLAQAARYAAHGVCYAIFTDYDRALQWSLDHPLPVAPRREARL